MKSLKLKTSVAVLLSIFGLALAGPVYAASKPAPAMKSSQAQSVALRNVRLSELIGKDVRNAQGEDLGDIKDAVIDINNGRVHYVVLSFGGFLGLGDKLFAYPMRAFSPTADKDELVLNVAKERLKDAPGFEANRYPDFQSADYRGRVDRYFGPTLAIESRPNMRLIRGSELLGKDVNGANGRDLGEIKDVVVSMANGNVHYAVLEFDKSWSLNDKLFAFPLRSFKQGAKWSDDLVLNISKDTLNNVPGFDRNAWPNLNDPKWNADIDALNR
jgi:sporulation protein YlmC with PRC-barrel domain